MYKYKSIENVTNLLNVFFLTDIFSIKVLLAFYDKLLGYF